MWYHMMEVWQRKNAECPERAGQSDEPISSRDSYERYDNFNVHGFGCYFMLAMRAQVLKAQNEGTEGG